MTNSVMRRKLGGAGAVKPQTLTAGQVVPDQVWRLALARAARDELKLVLDMATVEDRRVHLGEVLERAPEQGLFAVLQGPGEALGVIMLSPELLAGLIEMQTTGRVSSAPVQPRRPTRTDASMVAGIIDRALANLETGLAREDDQAWALGYRYSSYLADARPLGLLLEERPYRLLTGEVSLAMGAKRGALVLALPAEVSGGARVRPDPKDDPAVKARLFTASFAEQLREAPMKMEAVLHRLSLPLSEILNLEEGQVLALYGADIGEISLEGMDGRKLWLGRLGQNRGMRALRLTDQLGGQAALAVVEPPSHETVAGMGNGASIAMDDRDEQEFPAMAVMPISLAG